MRNPFGGSAVTVLIEDQEGYLMCLMPQAQRILALDLRLLGSAPLD